MKSAIVKILESTAIPFGLILLCSVFVRKTGTLTESLSGSIQNAPYIIFLAGMTLSCLFNRNRIFFVLTVLAMSRLALTTLAPSGDQRTFYMSVVYPSLCAAVPLNMAAFSFLKERGILTRYGKNLFSLIMAQLVLVAWMYSSGYVRLINAVNYKIFKANVFNLTPIPQIPLLIFMIVLIILLVRQSLNTTPLDGSFAGALAAAAAALHFRDDGFASACFFAVSGLILVIAVIQDSYSKAYLDELTGLPGRRALKEEMMKLGGRYSIGMLDVDFFKSINDEHGHDVGDQVLKYIASMIKEVGGGGKSFRYGGEEFAIIFPGRGVDEAASHLEKLRERISRRGFFLRGKDRKKKKPAQIKSGKTHAKKLNITVSIGVCGSNGRRKTAEEVIKAADAALYRAKESGRNCVVSM
ncbi:MAG TPA: GGDEF domain-containing protein [Bacillota bacterium]|nr:GGDEF domain-containing protein [Bacillota bacterium]